MAEQFDAAQIDAVRQLLAAHLPDLRDSEIRVLGAGLDNISYLAGGDVVIRLPRTDGRDAGMVVRGETEVLIAVGRRSPIAVPRPVARLDTALIYRVLPGVPLIGVPDDRREHWAAAIGATLGRLLTAVHAIGAEEIGAEEIGAEEIGAEEIGEAVAVDDDPLQDWLDEAAECYAAARRIVPAVHRESIEHFLTAPAPPDPDEICFGHRDLGAEHVLVDPRTGSVTGVIDWSDAGFGDPAVDFGLLLRDLGPAGYRAAVTAGRAAVAVDPGVDQALDIRAQFYARCRTLEDLRFGLAQGRPEYTANSLRAMSRLFAAGQ